jgi:hypothetical protein
LHVVTEEERDNYLKSLSKHKKPWQVDQAKEAIGLYAHFLNQSTAREHHPCTPSADNEWKEAGNEMRKMLRLKRLSISTERTYRYWNT